MTIVFVDMDGVLTDFAGAAAELFGAAVPKAGAGPVTLPEAFGLSSRQFWLRVDDAGSAFWANLPATPFADELVALIRGAGHRLMIATSPSMAPGSAAGKVQWLQKRFGRNFRDYCIGSHKDLLAGPDRILLDDTPKHVDAFRAAGGEAVLIPTPVNGELQAGDDPLAGVKAILQA